MALKTAKRKSDSGSVELSKYFKSADDICASTCQRLGEEFFEIHSTIDLSKRLLGKYLCRRIDDTVVKGMIVETEAYLGVEDHASYSFGGRRTECNEPMYMKAGTCFVKFTYGMYHCFNLSTRDNGGAVLIRAVEPIEGIEKMAEMRRNHSKAPVNGKFDSKPHQLANGPSKLCIAFDIDRKLNKLDILTNDTIWIEDRGANISDSDIVLSTRIGISAKNAWANKELRYYLKNYKSVSKY